MTEETEEKSKKQIPKRKKEKEEKKGITLPQKQQKSNRRIVKVL